MDVTRYNEGLGIKIAVAADLHNAPIDELCGVIENEHPDLILIPGDIDHCHLSDHGDEGFWKPTNSLKFLEFSAQTAPTVLTLGNHERKYDDADYAEVTSRGVTILDNSWISICGVYIGGQTSSDGRRGIPDTKWLGEFSALRGTKILGCHCPEYYRLIKNYDISLILAGHAHGGQIRLFGHGLYAPGQGIFPKYTAGKYGNMIVSRGLAETGARAVPRINNPPELVIIEP